MESSVSLVLKKMKSLSADFIVTGGCCETDTD